MLVDCCAEIAALAAENGFFLRLRKINYCCRFRASNVLFEVKKRILCIELIACGVNNSMTEQTEKYHMHRRVQDEETEGNRHKIDHELTSQQSNINFSATVQATAFKLAP